ncbi:MAG: DUF3277 family protein [Clostridiales bacterium]|nr:DUF3277 family protein [Clostridiales bacterium]
MAKPYSSELIDVIVNSGFITGYAEDGLYNYEEGDKYNVHTGAQGETEHSKIPGNACTITLTLKKTSPSNKYLNNLAKNEIPINMTIDDKNENGQVITGTDGVIMSRPNDSGSTDIGTSEWVFSFKNHKRDYK